MHYLLNKEENDVFISGGYRIIKKMKRLAYMSEDLLPDDILTTSNCIVNTIPNTWAINWINEENKEQKALNFGINKEKFDEIKNYVTSQIDEGEIGIPNIFYTTDDARNFLSRFNISTKDLILLGIGIHVNCSQNFIESTKIKNVMDGLIVAVEKGFHLEKSGIFLGYEIYGHETNSYHSWLCNGLEKVAYEKFFIKPNEYGLISSYEKAEKCIEYFENIKFEIEQVPWFPWKIMKYVL